MFLLGMAVALSPATSADAKEGDCVAVTLAGVSADCAWTYTDFSSQQSSGDGYTWVVALQCDNGGICVDRVECVEAGVDGYVSDVFRDGVDVGDVCVPETDVSEVDYAKLVLRAFKTLNWPASPVGVDPPDGLTLVNFDTYFYTTNASSTIKNVFLGGKQIDIQATPVSYDWSFGDDTVATTASAGAPYPNGDVVHVYVTKDDFEVSVDTTYSGQYKIGNGGWKTIDAQVTVQGPIAGLSTLEATPELVTDPGR